MCCMENFSELWNTVCLKEKGIDIEKYLLALDELRETGCLVGIDRRLYESGKKLAINRFAHKLRFMKMNHIIRVVVDSTCPYGEWFEILPTEEWNFMK